MLKAIKQYQLIDKDGSQGESPCVDPALGRHLTVNIKDTFELPIEVLDGSRTQLVEDTTDFHSRACVRIRSRLGCDQVSSCTLANRPYIGSVVVFVSQEKTDFFWKQVT